MEYFPSTFNFISARYSDRDNDAGDLFAHPRVIMQPEPIQDEDYASEEDSDFAPDDAPAEGSSVSDNDDDDQAEATENATQPKRKRPAVADGAEEAGFENSGDEAIIEKGKKRQKKSKRKDVGADEDEGGEGGLVKTRRMRAAEYAVPSSLDLYRRLLLTPATERPKNEHKPPAARSQSTSTRYGRR